MVYLNRVQPLPYRTAACAAREEKFCAAWAVGLPGFLKAVGLTLLAWQADPQGLVMVIGPMALVALREVSVLGWPFLGVWSLPAVAPMKDQLSVFSILRRPAWWRAVKCSRWTHFDSSPGAIIGAIK